MYGKIEIYGATIDYRYDIFGGPPNNMTGEDWTFLRTGTRSVNDNDLTLRVILRERKEIYTVLEINRITVDFIGQNWNISQAIKKFNANP